MFRRLLLVALSMTLAMPVHAAKSTSKKRAIASKDPSAPYGDPNRPPQYVLLAFDGSKDNAFWDESMAFADTVKTDEGRRPIRFTYFINPTYYLAQENRKKYFTPGVERAGMSCIGYSNKIEDIPPRIARTNKAFKSGHEIGSHANAHCDQTGIDKGDPMYGHPWGEKEWTSEFNQFNTLLFDSFKINGLKPVAPSDFANGFSFTAKNIKGFRAPKLAFTSGMWPTLEKFGFTYDTSLQSPPDKWPTRYTKEDPTQKFKGWKFPLARIKIAGTTKSTLSMDFNWFVYQTGGVTKKDMTDADYNRMYNQMMDSYKYYFKKNYLGNRAAVHIGHHFSKWNRGVYWQVMKDFSKYVCNMPEVKCVTYSEYVDYLDTLPAEKYKNYSAGLGFTPMRFETNIKDISTPVLAEVRLDMGANRFEAIIPDADKVKAKALGWKPEIQLNTENQRTSVLSRGEIAQKVAPGGTVMLRATLLNKSGAEMNWETYKINKFGTDEETVVGPLENMLLEGESSEAHADHD